VNPLQNKWPNKKTNGTSYGRENRGNMLYMPITCLDMCIAYLIPADVLFFLFQLAVFL